MGYVIEYAKALAHHFSDFLTGGAVAAIAAALSGALGVSIPRWLYVVVFLGGGVLVAGFRAWRELYLTTTPLGKRASARRLNDLANYGIRSILNETNLTADLLRRRMDQWEHRVAKTMDEAGCAETEKAEFKVLGDVQNISAPGPTDGHRFIQRIAFTKVSRLRKVAARLEGLPARSEPSTVVLSVAAPAPGSKDQKESPLEATFIGDQPPYEEHDEGPPTIPPSPSRRIIRIGIRNKTSATLVGRALVQQCDPPTPAIELGRALEVHQNQGERDFTVYSSSAPTAFITLFTETWFFDGRPCVWEMHFWSKPSVKLVPGNYAFTIEFVGDFPALALFVGLSAAENGRMLLALGLPGETLEVNRSQ